MVRSLYSAASGMMAQQTNVDVIANNLANVNTIGYKSQSAEFKSLLYQDLQAKTTSANGENKPVSAQVVATKAERDDEIRAIFEGKEDKLILVIGPCSADNEDAVIDYISRLRKVQDKVADKIFMIPRIYTNKPRTIGIGYKGMLHQPDPEKETDMLKGIIAIRQMHKRAVEETGFTCADEMLYPENHRYLSDLLS